MSENWTNLRYVSTKRTLLLFTLPAGFGCTELKALLIFVFHKIIQTHARSYTHKHLYKEHTMERRQSQAYFAAAVKGCDILPYRSGKTRGRFLYCCFYYGRKHPLVCMPLPVTLSIKVNVCFKLFQYSFNQSFCSTERSQAARPCH